MATKKNSTQMGANDRRFADVRWQVAVIKDVKQYSAQIQENLQAIADSLEFAPNEAPKYGVDEYATAAAMYTIQVAKLHAFASGRAIGRGITFSFHKDYYQNKYVFCINRGLGVFYDDHIEIQNGLPLFMAIRSVLKNQEKLIGKVHFERYTAFGDGVTYVPAKYYPVYTLSVPSGITFWDEYNKAKDDVLKVEGMNYCELCAHAYHVQLVLASVSGTKYYAKWLEHELAVYQKLNGRTTVKVGLIQDARQKKFVTIRSFKTNGEATGHIVCLPGTAADFETFEAIAKESCVSMIHW